MNNDFLEKVKFEKLGYCSDGDRMVSQANCSDCYVKNCPQGSV